MENQRKRTIQASVCCIIVNISMNALFVAALRMGEFGLGLGSSLGMWAFLMVMALYCFSGKAGMKFVARSFSWRGGGAIVAQGYPGAISRFVEMFRCLIVRVGADARIDIEVNRFSRVLEVSRQVIDFCERRGIDRRRAFLAGLSLEEMAGYIVQHGFVGDKRRHLADIRVVHGESDVILRLRDNCFAFDPMERVKLMDRSDDGVSNIGIRMIHGLAKDVQYQNLLGLNVLTIHV